MKRVRPLIGRFAAVAATLFLVSFSAAAPPGRAAPTNPNLATGLMGEIRAAETYIWAGTNNWPKEVRRVLRIPITLSNIPTNHGARVTLFKQALGGLAPTGYLGLGSPPSSGGGGSDFIYFDLGGDNFTFSVDVDPVSAGGFRLMFSHKPTANGNWVSANCYFFANKKLYTGDASIDTRKEYGEPNNENYVPDANAPLTPVNFGAWTYRGGLFAGYVPWTSNDYSGLARIQLWQAPYEPGSAITTNYPTYRGACVSLYHTGIPTKVTASGDPLKLGLYLPNGSEPNPNESTLSWDTRWNITAGSLSDPSPLLVTSFTQGECANWNVSAFERICIAVMNETNWINSNQGWLYFASKEYDGLNLSQGVADIAPRAFPIHSSEWEPYTGTLPW